MPEPRLALDDLIRLITASSDQEEVGALINVSGLKSPTRNKLKPKHVTPAPRVDEHGMPV